MKINGKFQKAVVFRRKFLIFSFSSLLLLLLCYGDVAVSVAATTDVVASSSLADYCPVKCTCKSISENSKALKVKCGGLAASGTHEQLTLAEWRSLDFAEISANVIIL